MKKKSANHKNIQIPKLTTQRQEKLPSQKQKPAFVDHDAPKRMKELLKNPNYRIADEDPDFLREDAVRGMRLQADYLKTELLLKEYGIKHTIVVFGGTRIVEKSEALLKLQKIQKAIDKAPGDETLIHKQKVAKNVLQKSCFYEISREFGRIIGLSGDGASDCSLTIMTGGGPGIMEAANRGAFDVGAKSIGLNISLPHEQFPNPYISPELCFRFHYFSMRKLHFFSRAKALVAFPGGYGTMDELMEALTLVQTRKIVPFPIILVGRKFWEKIINFDHLLEEGVIDVEDLKLFWYAENAQEIWDYIVLWYKKNNLCLT